jgi:hypothetical protein
MKDHIKDINQKEIRDSNIKVVKIMNWNIIKIHSKESTQQKPSIF